jgi:hypothetical protein
LLSPEAPFGANDSRVFSGIIGFNSDDEAAYYFMESLREAQADHIGIDDDDIEAQTVFIENREEIWNVRYPPPLSE